MPADIRDIRRWLRREFNRSLQAFTSELLTRVCAWMLACGFDLGNRRSAAYSAVGI